MTRYPFPSAKRRRQARPEGWGRVVSGRLPAAVGRRPGAPPRCGRCCVWSYPRPTPTCKTFHMCYCKV